CSTIVFSSGARLGLTIHAGRPFWKPSKVVMCFPFRVTPKQLKELSLGTFLYAGLFATEGVGLLLRKRWAEYFTIVTTSALIPLEVFELARHFTMVKLAVVVVNALIVLYLVARVRSR